MSKEAKEKIDMDPKYIIKLTVTLLITCVVVAGILGYVNSITAGPIADANAEKTNTALAAVFPDAAAPEFPEVEISDDMAAAATGYSATLENVYEVQDGGSTVGHAVKIIAAGSQGNIEMVVGVDADGVITGVSIVSNSETSGIGSKVMANTALPSGTGVLDQFIGKATSDQPLKVGSNVDAISGATVSSKGVTKGVNGALAAVEAIG
ncbi:MAG: RnfABCDGE type electron transport complex subunit G [Oscillibacter sp.]|jgi:electron transport complex protein RnfG|nr:RnfABCDGE type electron transport complex subunit G [Oscillibacter sp.]